MAGNSFLTHHWLSVLNPGGDFTLGHRAGAGDRENHHDDRETFHEALDHWMKLEEEIEKYTSTKKQGKQPSNKRQKQERTSRSSIFSNRSGKGSDAGGRPSVYSIKGKQKRDIV